MPSLYTLSLLFTPCPLVPRGRYVELTSSLTASKRKKVTNFEELLAAVRANPLLHGPWFLVLSLAAYFWSPGLIFCLVSFAAAVVGLVQSPFWFAVGLLEFASKSAEIRIVTKVVLQVTHLPTSPHISPHLPTPLPTSPHLRPSMAFADLRCSLSQNSRSILMTIFFMTLVIYIFAVVGYLHLAEYFFYMDFNEEAVPMCTSLLQV